MGTQQKQGSVPHPECAHAHLIQVKKPWMFSFWKTHVRRTDFTQLGMRYFTVIFDTIDQIGDICESCFGIISLGSLGALKQKKNPSSSNSEFRSVFTCTEIKSIVNFCDSVLAYYQLQINTNCVLCKSPAYSSTSVTKETKLAILLDHVKPTSKANLCSLISHLEC